MLPPTEMVLVLDADFHISGKGRTLGKVSTRSTSTPRSSQLTLEDLAAVLVVEFSGRQHSSRHKGKEGHHQR